LASPRIPFGRSNPILRQKLLYIRPATPRLNGKVDRSDRLDPEEFYRLPEGQVVGDVNLFNNKLQEWGDYYNYDRPHGALAGATPYERLKQKTQDPLS
jgi:transposase InsO family protein